MTDDRQHIQFKMTAHLGQFLENPQVAVSLYLCFLYITRMVHQVHSLSMTIGISQDESKDQEKTKGQNEASNPSLRRRPWPRAVLCLLCQRQTHHCNRWFSSYSHSVSGSLCLEQT
jgi:hypothetical protein